MKVIVVAVLLVGLRCAACWNFQAVNCSTPTTDEVKCMTTAGQKEGAAEAIATHCKGVDFNALLEKKFLESHICQVPDCITELDKIIYTPCNRTDLKYCLHHACAQGTHCSLPTEAEMKCMVAAGEKNGADIPTHCKGVDFDALKNGKLAESHICQVPECISTLNKDVYTPCNRSDFATCIRDGCSVPEDCSVPTANETKCMAAAGEKNGEDLAQHCKGVDFDAVGKGNISSLCKAPDCTTALERDVYAPCKRSGLAACIRYACMHNISCKPVTEDDMKCMKDTGEKNGAELTAPCKGVDMDALAKGNIPGSNLCRVPQCITALGKYVYTPCKRSDLVTCIQEVCQN